MLEEITEKMQRKFILLGLAKRMVPKPNHYSVEK